MFTLLRRGSLLKSGYLRLPHVLIPKTHLPLESNNPFFLQYTLIGPFVFPPRCRGKFCLELKAIEYNVTLKCFYAVDVLLVCCTGNDESRRVP